MRANVPTPTPTPTAPPPAVLAPGGTNTDVTNTDVTNTDVTNTDVTNTDVADINALPRDPRLDQVGVRILVIRLVCAPVRMCMCVC